MSTETTNHIRVDDTGSSTGGPSNKRKRVDSTQSEATNKRQRVESTKASHVKKSRFSSDKACYLRAGRYSFGFEESALEDSHTLYALVNSEAELDTDENGEDIWREEGATTPTAGLNPARFSEACAHTAWLFLRNGKEPSLATFNEAEKWDVGADFRKASALWLDGGELTAAAQVFDIGLGLRCPKLQKAGAAWYERVRITTGRSVLAAPWTRAWTDERMPEWSGKVRDYQSWLKILEEHDPQMIQLRKGMIEATEAGKPGLATDIPEFTELALDLSMFRHIDPRSYEKYLPETEGDADENTSETLSDEDVGVESESESEGSEED